MSPSQADSACLWDMLQAAREVQAFVAEADRDHYLRDRQLQMAVERGIEIIGEAARGLSAEFRKTSAEIPWAKIIALRNVLVHEYGEIQQERIWLVATVHIPELVAKLSPLLPPDPKAPEEG